MLIFALVMTTRQLKLARLIQKELSQIFIKVTKSWFGNVLLTVTSTEISADLSVCKVYVSVLLASDKNEVIFTLNENNKTLRHQLGTQVRHQLRIVPELIFILDDSADYAIHIDSVIQKLK